jgi:hypothetical protein
LLIGIAVLTLIYIYLFSVNTSIRPYYDDMLFSVRGNFLEYIHGRYNWSGRLTSATIYIVGAILSLSFLWLIPVITFLLLGWGTYALSMALMPVSNKNKQDLRLLAVFISLMLPFVIFLVTPSAYSSIYWFAAVPLHSWSYGLLAIMIAKYVRLGRSLSAPARPQRAKEFGVVLVFSLLGEFATLLALGLSALYIACNVGKYRIILKNSWHIGGALIIGLLILLFSPGSLERAKQLNYLAKVPLGEGVSAAYRFMLDYMSGIFSNHKPTFSLLFITAVFIVSLMYTNKPKIGSSVRKDALITFVVGLISLAVIFLNLLLPILSYRSVYTYLPRTFIPNSMALVVIILVLAWFAARLLLRYARDDSSRMFLAGMGTMLLILGVVKYASVYYMQVHDFRAAITDRKAVYDERDAYIKNLPKAKSGKCTLYVPPAPVRGTQEGDDLVLNPKSFLNQGVKRYYRIGCEVVAGDYRANQSK